MIERSFDPVLFESSFLEPEDLNGVSPEDWVNNKNNLMLVEDGSICLFVYEYPGLYTGHWFFKVRGREALNLASRMVHKVFEEYGMKALRGVTPEKIPQARWAARQIGMTSYGFIDTRKGSCELFVMTKDEFYKRNPQ